jgi:3-oxoacyl-(acyl-carrier-protein) synthase
MGELIGIDNYRTTRLSFASEKDTLPRLAAQVKNFFATADDSTGLYLVSANAGSQSAVEFWAEARRTGLHVASPERFPWTLANAAASWLSLEFKITGPTFTYLGQTKALLTALDQARDHLDHGVIRQAFVIALDFAESENERTVFAGLKLSAKPSGTRLVVDSALLRKEENASAYLSRIVRRLARAEAKL